MAIATGSSRASIGPMMQEHGLEADAVVAAGRRGVPLAVFDLFDGNDPETVEAARARGHTVLDAERLDKRRQRYDEAAAFGIINAMSLESVCDIDTHGIDQSCDSLRTPQRTGRP